MIRTLSKSKIEYGDFQTPLELAEKVCKKLVELGVIPDVIIEPTCGIGNFLEAANDLFPLAQKIFGLEINNNYFQKVQQKINISENIKFNVECGDFFNYDWLPLINKIQGKILILGNFPWVTNSQQGVISGVNLPSKNNFLNYNGLDAVTGKSNFDISEWMLIQAVQWLQNRHGYLAMLCKASVSRKIINYLYKNKLNLNYCATYQIDTKKYFDAAVDANLLFCKFDLSSQNYFCDVFDDLESDKYYRIGYREKILVRDVECFDRLKDLYDKNSQTKWRSGVKHDCSDVMELRKVGENFINGLGEVLKLEDTFIFPLIKGSDVAQKRIYNTERYLLVTQRFIGESTEQIKKLAPKTWNYLESHATYLDNRKSKIYQKNPRFSIFGVGSYTFAPWKIAICGLYKKLNFRLVGQIGNKPVVFDDTVYFLSFDDEQSAYNNFELLTSQSVTDFYSSLIFTG